MMKSITHPIASLPLLICVLSLLLLPISARASVTARLSQQTTSLDQPVRLTLESDGDQEPSPDLSVLDQDFEILARASQQSISIINGRMSAKRSLILTLLPKRAGDLTIPPIPFGDQATQALSLTVSEQPSPPPSQDRQLARVELSLNKARAYPEEEVILTLKLYQAPGVRGERLDELRPSLPDTHLQLLNETEYTTEEDGALYRVLERSYALFAYQAGDLEIAPVGFVGRSGGSAFFSLFDDPFGNGARPARLVRASSNPVSLKVEPVPAAFAGSHWLPAKNLQLLETGLDTSQPMLAGKPLTRRIMLLADGLMSNQLPAIAQTLPKDIKPYEERPQLNDTTGRTGISGSRQSTITLMPTRAGHYTLPAIEIPWWNTETDQQEVARLPAVELDILPNPDATDIPPQTVRNDRAEVSPPQAVPATDQPVAAFDSPRGPSISWLVWLLGGAWLATLLAWWLVHRRSRGKVDLMPEARPAVSSSEQRQAIEAIKDAMGQAYARSDAEAAREAWLKWAQLIWPEQPPNNLTRLAKRVDPRLSQAVIALEKALYSPGRESDWNRFDPQLIGKSRHSDQDLKSQEQERLMPLNP